MSDSRAIGEVISLDRLRELAERGSQSTPQDDSGFQRRQAEMQRAANLRAAAPRVSDEDRRLLETGKCRQTKFLTATQRWLGASTRPVLCLGGTVGTGKTFAALWALSEHGGSYAHANDLVRAAVSFDEAETWRRWCASRLLVLDDLASESAGDRMGGVLLDLLDRRKGDGRRTLVTTNQSQRRLRERYPDARLWSRLDSEWAFVGFAGEDMRR